jgi:hypothetical protein
LGEENGMATYAQWNQAIAEYFLSGLPLGSTVYLSIDDETLTEIGDRFLKSQSVTDWVEDFVSAVRSTCIREGELHLVGATEIEGIPRCVAFLGAMVLAAHRMADEDAISEGNYFLRLRQVFGLNNGESGRPRGLQPPGVEKQLWLKWGEWLLRKGFLPTAEAGRGSSRFINYPLSQALLRKGDKRRLEREFRRQAGTHHLSKVWDRDRLASWLRFNSGSFNSNHLRDIFQQRDPIRSEAILDSVFDLYSSMNWNVSSSQQASALSNPVRRITGGLYRAEDPISGTIEYRLYPREPRRWQGTSMRAQRRGEEQLLRPDRPGWFIPIWSENPAGGMRYRIDGDPHIKELVMPEREFWILVSDPENEDSGVFASWGSPGVSESFILLCHRKYEQLMKRLENAGLLEWDQLAASPASDGWIEYRGCRIISATWNDAISDDSDLCDALRPNVPVSISLRSGLRVSRQNGWLEGYGPEVALYSFEKSLRLVVRNIQDFSVLIVDQVVATNQHLDLPRQTRGDYLLQVFRNNALLSQVSFRILPWNTLRCSKPELSYSINLPGFSLQGANLIEKEEFDG